MVVGLPVEQQPVEPGGRVVLRLPATGAAGAVHGTAARATAVAPAASERRDGAADDAAQRSASEASGAVTVVVTAVVVVELIVGRPAPRTGAQRVPVEPPVGHGVDGRMGVAQQQSGHGGQPVDGGSAVDVVVVVVVVYVAVVRRRRIKPIGVQQSDGVR